MSRALSANTRLAVLFALSVGIAAGCSSEPRLETFASDGCSLFPDRAEALDKEWCHCCLEHDVVYWQGGTREQREAADQQLRNCVAEATGSDALARVMYEGVRTGGGPEFPTWYRWGYGWSPNQGYTPLTEAQRKQVRGVLDEYQTAAATAACGTAN
ncbi:MAG: hypothetical protein AAFN07_12720 [Pseudomonadota bacterium]